MSPSEAPRGRGRPSSGVRDAVISGALELIHDVGLARLTTREVARRAGVSEASVFYHFGDRVGLLQAVVLSALEPLKSLDLSAAFTPTPGALQSTLSAVGQALESFFDRALPIIEAMQSDVALRQSFARSLAEGDLGPHRGVRLVAAILTQARTAGDTDISAADADPIAMMLVSACFLRAWQRHLDGDGRTSPVPSLDTTVAALVRLIGTARATD